MNDDHFIKLPELFSGSQFQSRAQILGETTLPISTQTYDFTKSKGYGNAPSTNGSYGYIGIGGGNLLTLPTPVVKPNTTPAVI